MWFLCFVQLCPTQQSNLSIPTCLSQHPLICGKVVCASNCLLLGDRRRMGRERWNLFCEHENGWLHTVNVLVSSPPPTPRTPVGASSQTALSQEVSGPSASPSWRPLSMICALVEESQKFLPEHQSAFLLPYYYYHITNVFSSEGSCDAGSWSTAHPLPVTMWPLSCVSYSEGNNTSSRMAQAQVSHLQCVLMLVFLWNCGVCVHTHVWLVGRNWKTEKQREAEWLGRRAMTCRTAVTIAVPLRL